MVILEWVRHTLEKNFFLDWVGGNNVYRMRGFD